MTTKVCTKCGVEKSLSEFYIRKTTGPRISYARPRCRECEQKSNKISYAPEKAKERNRLYKLNNLEKFLESRRKSTRRWRLGNPEAHLKGARRSQRKRLAAIRIYNNQPNRKLIRRVSNRIWYALKGQRKSARTIELLGCPVEILRLILESQFQSGMTWENYGPVWHIDHIRPCASFDLSDSEQQKQCFHYTNLQPLWAHDNLSQGAKRLTEKVR